MYLRNPILIAAMLAVAASACSKAGDSSQGSVAKSAFKVFSADSDFIAGVNGAELRKSKYFDEVKKKLPGEAMATLARFKECGIDVVGGLSSAVIAGQTTSKEALIQVNGFYRNELKMCDGVQGVTIVDEGPLSIVSGPQKEQVLGWVGEGSFITGMDLGKAQISERLAAKSGVDKHDELMSMLGRVDTSAAVWMAFYPPGGKMPVPMVGDLQGIFASVWLDGGLKLDLGIRMKSSSDAEKLAKLAARGLPQAAEGAGELGKFVANIKVTSKGSDVIVKVTLTDAELIELINAAQKDPRLQMMMGMLKR